MVNFSLWDAEPEQLTVNAWNVVCLAGIISTSLDCANDLGRNRALWWQYAVLNTDVVKGYMVLDFS